MKKQVLALTIVFLLTACAPTQSATPTPYPTHTPYPTYTAQPSPTEAKPTDKPAPTLTPTIQINIAATETKLQSEKEFFSNEVIRLFKSNMGCLLAEWNESSFEVVCVMVPVDNDQDLLEVAYELTYGLANQMLGMNFDFCFDEGFSFLTYLMSSDERWIVSSTTPGDVLGMLVNNQVETMENWMELATVDLLKADDKGK